MALHARSQFGRRGEGLAGIFFMKQGFRVIARNWYCRFGEIDLIIEKEGKVHFVEVKTRRSTVFGYPEESITKTKLRHLARAVECWLEHQRPIPKHYQVDAVLILWVSVEPQIRWVEGIL